MGFSVSDDGLNYSDTWVQATQTVAETTYVTTDEAILDPVTGQYTTQITLAENPQSVPSLAGYGYNGALRVTTDYSSSDGDEIATVRQIDDATMDVDGAGFASEIVLAQEPARELGTLVDAQIDVTTSSGDGYSCSADCIEVAPSKSPAAPSFGAGPSTSRTVEKLNDAHVRVSEIWTVKAQASDVARMVADPLVRHARDYEKRGNDWVLTRVRNESTVRYATGETRSVQNITISDVKWNRNPVEDAKRKARRELRGQGVNFAASAPLRSESCDPMTAITECEGETSGEIPPSGAPPPGYATVPRINEAALIQTDEVTYPQTGSVSLVLQHGLFSSDETWAAMRPWLQQDVSVFAIARKTVPWRETYEDQAEELHRKLRTGTNITGPMILMGHSNGGMVSRYLARHPDAYDEANGTSSFAPINVRGVVTLGTPHKGAPLGLHARGLSNILGFGGWAAKIICTWTQMAGCLRFSELRSAPIRTYVEQYHSAWPVTAQMLPNSSYHANFNAQPEPFQRYGVQSYIGSKKWLMWNLNGDMSCFPWEECGGRAEAKKTDRIYKRDISCAIVGIFVMRWGKAAKCALDAAILKAVDVVTIRHLGAKDEPTDGIVPRSSQLYPNIPMTDQFEIWGGPNHWSETKSWDVFVQFKRVLGNRFLLLVRQ